MGHTLTLMLVGGVVLAMGTAMPKHLERTLEMGVGLMLILLGIDVLQRVIRQRIHFHAHRHDSGELHVHAHSHALPGTNPSATRLPNISRRQTNALPVINLDANHSRTRHDHDHVRQWPLRALAVGMMHGLAGSAALIVLSLETMRSASLGMIYILIFGIGSIAGMASLSAVIAIPLRLSGKYLSGLYRSFAGVIGVLTISLGTWVVYQIGFVEGLLLR
jgi:ABC-type nickel/cobalt efflux system permease component RcnA